MSSSSEELLIRRLLDVGRELMTDVDLGAVLDRVLRTAQDLTGARYAAVGILNDQSTELAEFLPAGVSEEIQRNIGDMPRGRGVLGVLIEHPEALRLADLAQHPSSCGFPAGHPVMHSFLGVPIVTHGQAWGNLYLAEKQGSEFSEQDEEAARILADWAAVAIDNVRRYEAVVSRREEVERALRGLEATHDVTVTIGGEIAFEHMLELIVKRGRALVGARSLVIMLRKGHELVVEASAGHAPEMQGARLPIAGSSAGQVLERRRPERITDVTARLRAPREFDVGDARTALLVPMLFRGDAVGVLAAFDRGEDGSGFSEDDEQMLGTFAASAATAVALAQSVQDDRLRSSMEAADAERRRWARELHDETLQGLGGLRVLLSSALRREQLEQARTAMREALEHIDREIANLRSIITELRPAALDELGLRTAIEALLDRQREQSGFEIEAQLTLSTAAEGGTRLDDALETTVYRLVQEALTNATKHARASNVLVAVGESEGALLVEVKDDGAGFDPESGFSGFGLAGMKERVGLAGGTLSIESDGQGTSIRARLPARLRQAAGDRSTNAAARRPAS